MNPTAPLSLSDRFVMTLEGLYAATAARYRSAGWTIPLLWAVCNRIRRVERRVLKLLELFRAGMLPPEVARPRRPRAGERRVVDPDAVRQPGVGVRIPRGYAWLLPMVPCAAANFACQLRLLLAEPEMMALLAASAKARRALAPLCRMLAIEPEVIESPAIKAGMIAPQELEPGPGPGEGEQDGAADTAVSGSNHPGLTPAAPGFHAGAHPPGTGPQGQGPPSMGVP